MTRPRKRTVAIVATSALAAVGGGVAVAATSADDPRDAIIERAAERLDVSPEKLRSALQGAVADQLDEAVRAGRLTREQAERIKQAVRERGVPLAVPVPGGPRHHHHALFGPALEIAADYLGIEQDELRRRLGNGRTLAQVARAEGKSVDGLKDALVAAARERLDRAVKDGRLTDKQRDRLVARIERQTAALVTGKLPRPPKGTPPALGHGPDKVWHHRGVPGKGWDHGGGPGPDGPDGPPPPPPFAD